MNISSFLLGYQAAKNAGGGGSSADVRYVTFMSYDGLTEEGRIPVAVGYDCPNPKFTSIRESTAQYDYTQDGWANTPNGEKDANWYKNITEDKTVYANFSSAVRSYTIRFCDEDTLIESQTLTYGATPTVSDPAKSGFSFDGWEPAITAVTGDATYTAKWVEAITFEGGSWEDIIRIAEAGEAQKYFALGDRKTFEYKLSTLETADTYTTTIQIVGFDHDDLADGSGKAAMSLLVVQDGILQMFPAYNSTYEAGWPTCSLRTKLNNTVLSTFPEEMRSSVKQVTKQSYIYNGNIKSSDDYVWVPSVGELPSKPMAGTAYTPGDGVVYPGVTVNDFSGSLLTSSGTAKFHTRSAGGSYQGICMVEKTSAAATKFIYSSESAYNKSLRTTFGFCI